MDVGQCNSLHYTLMKQKNAFNFVEINKRKAIVFTEFINVWKKKEIGKTAENHKVTEHDCHQQGNPPVHI